MSQTPQMDELKLLKSVSREIHVITLVDKRGKDCYTNSSLTIGTATQLGMKAVREKRAKSFRIDSFRIKVVGRGITWLEFERINHG